MMTTFLGVIVFLVGVCAGRIWDGRIDLTVRHINTEKVEKTVEEGYGFKPEKDKEEDEI